MADPPSDLIREMSAAALSRDRSLEYVTVTLAPREARSCAITSPIPREAPVTMALVDKLEIVCGNCRFPDVHFAF